MVKLTYEKAVEWCENHVPQIQFERFEDWLEACEQELNTPTLFENERFISMMRDSWQAGSSDREEVESVRRQLEEAEIEEPTSEPSAVAQITVDLNTGKPKSVSIPHRTSEIPISSLPLNEQIDRQSVQVDETKVKLPETGKAPELAKPVKKQGILQRITSGAKRLFRI